MSRFFSTAARRAKDILWNLNGSTKATQGSLSKINGGIDIAPGLGSKVTKGILSGDPHETRHSDGSVDPYHYSGVLGRGNVKGSKRVTSFRYHPETGLMTFSKPDFAPVQLEPDYPATEASQTQDDFSAQADPPPWIWDEEYQKMKYWDGFQWVYEQ